MKLILVVLLYLNVCAYGQTIIHHQVLSSQGTVVKLSTGVYVNQTVGQQTVIGNYSKNRQTYVQGFQQGIRKKYTNKTQIPVTTTFNYPNPFKNEINFQFSQSIEDAITVTVTDMLGRLVFKQKKRVNGNILTIELGYLPSDHFVVQLSALNFNYFAKILKQP